MKSFQDAILKTIQYLVNQSIAEAPFDRTTQGRITEIIGTNKYKVSLNGADRVLCCAVDLTLGVNDVVFITLPQNNLSSAYISGIKRR